MKNNRENFRNNFKIFTENDEKLISENLEKTQKIKQTQKK